MAQTNKEIYITNVPAFIRNNIKNVTRFSGEIKVLPYSKLLKVNKIDVSNVARDKKTPSIIIISDNE